MGTKDKILRTLVALIILILNYTGIVSGTLGIILLVLAGIFAITSFVSFCPLYLPFGISTCEVKKE